MLMDYSYRVYTRGLYKILGFKGEKIPQNFTKMYGEINCPLDYSGMRLVKLHIVVYPQGVNRGKHRIFAVCPQCEKEVPVGRLGQHIGAKSTCVAPYRRKVIVKSGGHEPRTAWCVDPQRLIDYYNKQGLVYELVQS